MAEVLPMPDVRRRRLKELEDVIASGWAEAVRVGQALREIRDDGLYLELGEGVTFEMYCKSRFDFDRSRGYQYIDAADVHDAVSTIGRRALPLLTERVGRELAPLLRDGGQTRVAEAWTKVSEQYAGQRPPTAREVHRVLVAEGYRPKVGQVSGGDTNAGILLGQVGERIAALEKRLDYFLNQEAPKRRVSKKTRTMATAYAARCDALATLLRDFSEGESA